MGPWLLALLSSPAIVISVVLSLMSVVGLIYWRGPDMVDARSRKRATKAALKAKTKVQRETALLVLERLAPADRAARRPTLLARTEEASKASADERASSP